MADSAIHWTDKTWNCVIGCTRVSAGCEHCYAETFSSRLAAMGQANYEGLTRKHGDGSVTWTGVVKCLPERLDLPLRWKKPARVFVNSMSDLFHDAVPDDFIDQVFAVMAWAGQHTFQVLTKRPERMQRYLSNPVREERVMDAMCGVCNGRLCEPGETDDCWNEGAMWPLANVWLGVSTEDQAAADSRIPHLLETPAAVRFISAEPLLEPLNLIDEYLHPRFAADDPRYYRPGGRGLDWVIVGGESGAGRRPFDVAWARDIREQCEQMGTAFFFKQGSGPRPGMNRELDGQLWEQCPEPAARA